MTFTCSGRRARDLLDDPQGTGHAADEVARLFTLGSHSFKHAARERGWEPPHGIQACFSM
jgi:hypothetical protein